MRGNNDDETTGTKMRRKLDGAKDQIIDTAVDKGLDLATHGAYSKLRGAPVVGKIVDKVGQKARNAVHPQQHQRPRLGVAPSGETSTNSNDNMTNNSTQQSTPSSNISERKLKTSFGRRALNFLTGRDDINKKKEENQEESNSTNETPTNEETLNNESDDDNKNKNPLASIVRKKKKMWTIRIGLVVSSIVLVLAFLMSFIMLVEEILTGNTGASIPFFNVLTYGTEDYIPLYETDSNEGKEENNYHKRLAQLANDYQKKNGMLLKTSYIHAILVYPYFEKITTIENTEVPIDFKKMSSMIDTVYKLMTASGNNVDYSKHGLFYNRVMASNDIRNYYKEVLQKDIDMGEILDSIFDLAEALSQALDKADTTTFTDETQVTVINQNNNNNNNNNNTSSTNTQTMSVTDYISGTIYASTDNVSDSEMIKAYTIAQSTNIVAKNKKLTINSNDAYMKNEVCNVKLGCSYNSSGKLVDGPGAQSSKNTIFYKGNYYYKKPLSDEEIKNMNANINSVKGYVLISENGTYPELDISKISKLSGGDYKSVLASAYGNNYDYKNISEGSYDSGAEYGNSGEVFINLKSMGYFYEQKDYASARFCGLKGYTIGGSGCGVTSMAMVASYYERDNKYDPVYMNAEATKRNMCGGGDTGTKQAFFGNMARAFKYAYVGVSKGNRNAANVVITHLSKGHLMVVRVGSGIFTGGGHYMVLAGIRPSTKEVYVYDPNNRNNSKIRGTGNGWYSLSNVILKEARDFYIMYK